MNNRRNKFFILFSISMGYHALIVPMYIKISNILNGYKPKKKSTIDHKKTESNILKKPSMPNASVSLSEHNTKIFIEKTHRERIIQLTAHYQKNGYKEHDLNKLIKSVQYYRKFFPQGNLSEAKALLEIDEKIMKILKQ